MKHNEKGYNAYVQALYPFLNLVYIKAEMVSYKPKIALIILVVSPGSYITYKKI